MLNFIASFTARENHTVPVEVNNQSVNVAIREINVVTKLSGDAEYYEGSYDVTPKAHQPQTLETKDKLMSDNVRVREIPFFETGNGAGGNTVYIANEV